MLIFSSFFVLLSLTITGNDAVYWTGLNFQAGDIIRCDLNIIGINYGWHYLLATSSSTIAHMVGDKDSNKGTLREETWSNYHRRAGDKETNCEKVNAGMSNAVIRAREDIEHYKNTVIYYNLYKCNCEHWVRYWANGDPNSYQVEPLYNGETNGLCEVGRTYGDQHEVMVKKNSDGNLMGSGSWARLTYSNKECLSFPPSSLWYDSITQIVPQTHCVRVWSRSDCSGNTWCICEEIKDLSYHSRNKNSNWNDDIISISGCDYGKPVVAMAMIYQKKNFGGASRKIVLQQNECLSLRGSDWWNDTVSSSKAILGCVRFYDDTECRGYSRDVSTDDSDYPSSWNDEASFSPC